MIVRSRRGATHSLSVSSKLALRLASTEVPAGKVLSIGACAVASLPCKAQLLRQDAWHGAQSRLRGKLCRLCVKSSALAGSGAAAGVGLRPFVNGVHNAHTHNASGAEPAQEEAASTVRRLWGWRLLYFRMKEYQRREAVSILYFCHSLSSP